MTSSEKPEIDEASGLDDGLLKEIMGGASLSSAPKKGYVRLVCPECGWESEEVRYSSQLQMTLQISKLMSACDHYRLLGYPHAPSPEFRS